MSHSCKVCNKELQQVNYEAQKEMCREHFTESEIERWLDNTDILTDETKGIVAWAKENLVKFTPNSVPQMHKELYYELMCLLNPQFKNKYERNLLEISYRGSAKSTAANTIFSSYLLAHNGRSLKVRIDEPVYHTHTDGKKEFIGFQNVIRSFPIRERFIVIISETATMAEDFVVTIRDEFSENDRLKYFYKVTIENAKESDTGQWTRRAFKFNGCFVMGKGTGQQIRGAIKGASRPTYVILDDIYSENSVKTEESRQQIRNWFYNAMYNSIDDLNGKCALLGTILHDDTVLMDLKNDDQWRVVVNYPMSLDKFHRFLNRYIKADYDRNECSLPFDEIENKLQRSQAQGEFFQNVQDGEDWGLAWKDRINLYYMALKYKIAVKTKSVDGFYQEYFHITISPNTKKFRREMFRKTEAEYEYAHGHNWIRVKGSDEWKVCNIEFGVDTSAGTFDGDNTVITIVAVTMEFKIYVLNQITGKFSLRDLVREGYEKIDKVCMDRGFIERVGFVDEVIRQALIYHPSKIKIGVAGEEKLNLEEVRRVFRVNRLYTIQIVERKQQGKEGNKHERILNGLIGYYESLQIFHCFPSADLEYELEQLGKAKTDDRADSLEVAVHNLQKPYSTVKRDSFRLDDREARFHEEHKRTKERLFARYKKIQPSSLRDYA